MASSQESTGNGGGQRRSGAGAARPREEIDKLKQKASQAIEDAKLQGKDKLEQQKEAAAQGADRLASAVERAASELGEDNSVAGYANQLAQGIHSLADNLRNRSLNELIDDAQSLARRNPAAFMVGSVAVGLALARFLKASSDRGQYDYETSDDLSGERSGDYSQSYGSASQSYGSSGQGYGSESQAYGSGSSSSELTPGSSSGYGSGSTYGAGSGGVSGASGTTGTVGGTRSTGGTAGSDPGSTQGGHYRGG